MKIGFTISFTPVSCITVGFDEFEFFKKFIRYLRKFVKYEYVVYEINGQYNYGIAPKNSATFGESVEVEDEETHEKKVIQWGNICDICNRKENAVIAINDKLRKYFSEACVTPIRSSKSFYEESKVIHTKCSKVKILAKTPGVLIKEQEHSESYRKDYFRLINQKLYDDENYELNYLFDKCKFDEYLYECLKNDDMGKIKESKQMLTKYLCNNNLSLKCGNTDPLTGSVIGMNGNDLTVACVGFKERLDPAIKEGALIKSPSLLKIINQQYDSLFEDAEEVTVGFIDNIIEEFYDR